MKVTALIFGSIALTSLTGCNTQGYDPSKDRMASISVGQSLKYEFARKPAEFQKQLSGKTGKFDGSGHGTQIEYFSPNGKAYLWYPGNAKAVVSEWRTQPPTSSTRYEAEICFRYPSNSYNPITKDFGGSWECRSSKVFANRMTALFTGDVFSLSNGSIPAKLPRRKTLNLEEVQTLSALPAMPKPIYQKRETY